MKIESAAFAAVCLAVCAAVTPAMAQPVTQTSPFLTPTGASSAMLRTGTEVPLRLAEELTTKGKKLRVGNRFRLETSEPVLVQGVTVIPAGSPAVGEITDVQNKGMWGKSGRFTARLLYLTANGRQVRLSGGFDDKGVAGGIGAVAVSAVVFLPAGFFMTGTSAKIPVGTVVKAFIDEDVPLAFAPPVQVPLQVPVATAPVTVPAPGSEVAPANRAPVLVHATTEDSEAMGRRRSR